MRKLLLASAAMVGGTMALVSVASAQTPNPYPFNMASPTPLQQPSPVALSPTPIPSPGFGTAIPSFGPPSVNSNMTVRLQGRMLVYAGGVSDSARSAQHYTASGGVVTPTNTKLANYGMFEYARLYPSFDAVAANGMKYGAFLEIRQDTGAVPGGGVYSSPSGQVQSRGNLYFRRETSYIGTDNLGFIRFGATDQPTSLMLTGTMENFDDGGWNGDPNLVLGNAQLVWPYADVGNLYATTKIVYMSPKFFDMVDFGVSFEPGTAGMGGGPGCAFANTAAATTSAMFVSNAVSCDATSASSVAAETARRRNTLDAVVRLRTALGPVGLNATIGTIQSGKVVYDGFTAPSTGVFNGLSVVDAGLSLTYGGFVVGGHILYGRDNGQWSLQPKGGTNMFAPLVGASYTYGSNVVGFHVFSTQDAGSWTQPGAAAANGQWIGKTRSQFGLAIGDTFTLAPGAYLCLSYLYGQRHQAGVDLLSGTVSSASNGHVYTNNSTRAQALFVGTMFRW
jgi:hypothetical protein